MLTTNIAIIFAFGLVITLIVLKGVMQAREFARQEEIIAAQRRHRFRNRTENVGY